MTCRAGLWIVVLLGLAGCSGQTVRLDCADNVPYVNEEFGYGFCVPQGLPVEDGQYGPIISGSQSVNVVARDQDWKSLEEYKEANLRQVTDPNYLLESTLLDGVPAWRLTMNGTDGMAGFRFESVMTVRHGVGITVVYTATDDTFELGHSIMAQVLMSWSFA